MMKWHHHFEKLRLRKWLRGCSTSSLFVVVGLLAVGPIDINAYAQVDSSVSNFRTKESRLKIPDLVKPDQSADLLLKSDDLRYDKNTGTATAIGNVEIYFDGYTITADRVTYSPDRDKLTARGNVTIVEPNKNVVHAEYIELSDKFREGHIETLYTVFTNQARLAAHSAVRQEGNTTVFKKVVYSACKSCEGHEGRPLLWQIKAKKVVHDKQEQSINYEHAKLEFFGVPVLYVPKFSHPDGSVKRKSGFLTPGFSISDEFGFGISTPYFWNLAPNYDVTFRPLFTTKQGLLADAEWRHRLTKGTYKIRPIGIYQLDPSPIKPGNRRFRGALFTEGEFKISNAWKWGWDAKITSDDTFLRRYNILSTNSINSQAYLTGLEGRNYFDLRTYHFRGTLATSDQKTTPFIFPALEHSYKFDQTVLGGQVGVDTNFFHVQRTSGSDSTRLSSTLSWRKTIKTDSGVVVTPFLQGRGDFYHSRNVVTSANKTDSFARIFGVGGVDVRMPWAKTTDSGHHIIEPVGQVIVRPNETETSRIPNEDSQSFEFGTTNLFSINKFPGVDRLEGGTRANVGVSYTYSHNSSGAWVRAVAGQSFQLAGRNSFGTDTGLETTSSDYVGELFIQPTTSLLMSARIRLDDKDLSVKRAELGISGSYDRLSGSVAYTKLAAAPAFGEVNSSEVINASARMRLNKYWSAFGNVYYDFGNDFRLRDGIGLTYEDECLLLSLAYSETFTTNRDIAPEKTLLINITLKTIGGGGFDAGL